MRLTDSIDCRDEVGRNPITPLQYLGVMYKIAKESLLHPFKTSTIDYDTLEVTRK